MRTLWKTKTIIVSSALFLLTASNLRASTVMHLDSVSTGPNQTAAFSLYISNDKPFVGFQLDINYPGVLTYVNGSAHLTTRATDQALSASTISPGVLRIIAYSVSLTAFNGSSGAVVTLNFTTGTSPGTYAVGISNATVADSSQDNILTSSYGGLLTSKAPRLEIAPQIMDFGSVPLYQSVTRTITLTNAGNIDLHVSKFSMNQTVFLLNDSTGVTIAAGGSVTRSISFKSSKKGTYNGTLTISSDDPASLSRAISLTGVTFAVNELRVGSVSGRSGYVFHLPVSINNMERFTGFQFKIPLPSVAKFVAGSVHLSGRAADHVAAADTSGNVLTVLAYSPSSSDFADTNGIIATIDLMVQGQGGSYGLSPADVVISDSSATNIESASYAGNLQVVSPTLSLSTASIGYGNVSAKDTARATLVISNSGSDTLVITFFSIDNSSFRASFTAPLTLLPGNSQNVQVLFHSTQEGTQNGKITVRSNDSQHDPAYVSLTANAFLPNVLGVVDGAGYKNENGLIQFNLDNMKPVTGFQCDVQVPSAISVVLDSIRLTSRKKDHVTSASVLSSGVIRIIAYSPTLAPFNSDSGAILDLPVTLGDTIGTFQIHISNVVLSDTAGKNVLTGTNDGAYQIRSRKITITNNLSASWTMVSVPVISDDYALLTLFPDAISKAFSFDQKYVSADTLHNRYGYWLKFGAPSVASITGLPIASDTFAVQTGWNMIGSISAAVSVDSIIESPVGNVSSFYFGFAGGYRVADSLSPGMGYWVKVFNTGSLILQTDAGKIYSSSRQILSVNLSDKSAKVIFPIVSSGVDSSMLDTLNYLTVSDAGSYSQKLYFGRTDIDSLTLLRYELPPKPPDGAFDARFGSNRFLEVLPQKFDSTDLTVEVQTGHYPVSLSWHISQSGIKYYAIENRNAGMRITQLSGNGSLVISDSSEQAFTLRCVPTIASVQERGKSLPINIGLEQNYPNPFNPSTIIRFDLPESQHIDLSVYDITGRKITTLANGKYSAGNHEATFNGSTYSSGVYIVRLITNGQTFSNKMVLLK